MANPITWRNVNAPSNHAAVRLLEGAQGSFNNAFKSLGDAIGNVQNNRQTEWDSQVQDNTQRFMDEIAKYQTPEELAAAQQSGVFDGLRSQFGDALDQERVRNAVPEFMTTLRNRTNAGNEYADGQRKRTEAPLIDQIKTHWLNGDTEAGNKLFQENDLQNDAGLLQFRNDLHQRQGDRAWEEQKRDRVTQGWNLEDQERENQEFVNGTLRNSLNQYREKGAEYGYRLQTIASDLGIPVDGSGQPLIDQTTPEQRYQLAQAMDGADLPSATAMQTNLMDTLLNSGRNLDVATINNARAVADQYQVNQDQLSSRDRQEVDTQVAKVERRIANNPYTVTTEDPLQSAATIVDKYRDKLTENMTDGQKDVAIEGITKALSDGHVIGEDGEKIPVTPAVVELALSNTEDGFWEIDVEFDDALREVVKNANLAGKYKEYLDAQNEIANIRAGALSKFVKRPGTVQSANAWNTYFDRELARQR